LPGSARKRLVELQDKPIGDLYLNSVDGDGTGQGYDLEVLDLLPKDFGVPVILAGGAGNANHFEAGLLGMTGWTQSPPRTYLISSETAFTGLGKT